MENKCNVKISLLTGNKVPLYFTVMNSIYFKHCNGIFVNNYLLTGNKVPLYFTVMNSIYFKHCNGIFVNNYLLTGNKVPLYFTVMNSRYFKHCNGIFVNNYLLTGNKVPLYFTVMNSRYFKHCNGIFVDNYLLTGNKVPLYSTEMNSRYFKHCNGIFVSNYLFHFIFYSKEKLKGKGIVITESLTKFRYNIYREALTKFGKGNVWTNEGRILTKINNKIHSFTTLQELGELWVELCVWVILYILCCNALCFVSLFFFFFSFFLSSIDMRCWLILRGNYHLPLPPHPFFNLLYPHVNSCWYNFFTIFELFLNNSESYRPPPPPPLSFPTSLMIIFSYIPSFTV